MRCAFIVHPLSKEDITRHPKFRWLRRLPLWLIELLLLFKGPSVVGRSEGVYSTADRGQGIEVIFVGVPLTPRMYRFLPDWFLNWRILQAISLAHCEGARVAGLGALNACVGDAGVTLNKLSPIPVTTGNTYTVATVVDAAFELTERFYDHIPIESRVLGIAGATGSIGKTCLELLKPLFGHVVLLSRDISRGEAVAQEFCLESYSVVTEPRFLEQAHVVVTVTSADTAFVGSEHISAGTLLVDVSRPRNVAVGVRDRANVLVIDGGVVEVPGLPDLGLDFGFPKGLAYACMSETMIDTLDGLMDHGNYRASTIGRTITVDHVARMKKSAEKHGFRSTKYRSFERLVTQAMLDEFAAHARSRQPQYVHLALVPD